MSETKNEIILRADGYIVLRINEERAFIVDDTPVIFDLLQKHRFFLYKCGVRTYPACKINKKRVLLQRLVINVPPGMCVHHRDGNSMHCCASNLLIKTRQKLLYDARRLINTVPGVYKRKNGFLASWKSPTNPHSRRYKLFPFSCYTEQAAWKAAMNKAAIESETPRYPRYYIDSIPK